jgi:hypothetical protein
VERFFASVMKFMGSPSHARLAWNGRTGHYTQVLGHCKRFHFVI